MIKEVIVVEGRDDYYAVKKAVDAEIIVTGGYSLPGDVMKRIKLAQERRGAIIFTDPDYAGERIRRTISSKVKGCRHAYLPLDEAVRDGDIGIENASPEAIREALGKARVEVIEKKEEFTVADLIEYKLIGSSDAGVRRDKIGRILGIGHSNAKQFISRLNNYGISREEFLSAVDRVKDR